MKNIICLLLILGLAIVNQKVYSATVYATNYGTQGNGDDTSLIQNAINDVNANTIIVSRTGSDWIIGPVYITANNKTIIFEPGVIVKAKQNAFPGTQDSLIKIHANNITLSGYGAILYMNKSEYSGENHHALRIEASSNIMIKGLRLQASGGDGIYVGYWSPPSLCENIFIKDVICDNNNLKVG